jgi:hypothetical protein
MMKVMLNGGGSSNWREGLFLEVVKGWKMVMAI